MNLSFQRLIQLRVTLNTVSVKWEVTWYIAGEPEFIFKLGLEMDYELHVKLLTATPHKAQTIRPPASHHENYPS